ncbi:unnamed protein product [Ilex paraguariensis]|uniref:SNRNP25 ubiquitin-like domain-containing protein n=1 Tax=Ilex paraguariensis TaxID=185542 RepID=A0ABC8SCP7_9AQUA
MQSLERDLEGDFSAKVTYTRNGSLSCAVPFSPLLLIENISRKSFSYNQLPQEPLELTILKLDGSCFDILVAKTATVAELKQAVEAAFSHLPRKEAGKISWPHVWGQFCLSYDGQKLLTDSDYIGAYGIKDADQLQFTRHVSTNYNLVKARSVKQARASKHPRISDSEESKQNGEEDEKHDQEGLKQDQDQDDDDDKGVITHCECKLTHLLRGWFSYRRLASSDMRFEKKSSLSRFTSGFLGSFKNILRVYGNKYDSETEILKWE